MPPSPSRPILFMYLGRLGALGRFTFELAQAAETAQHIDARFLISSNNENAAALAQRFSKLTTMATFERPTPGALMLGFLNARRTFEAKLADIRPAAVVNLMPHVWSPLLAGAVAATGGRFIPVIHDAVPHPGDRTARLTRWLLRDTIKAHRIVTLSRSVAQSLVTQGYASEGKVEALFHPDLRFDSAGAARTLDPARPLRVLFFGRIMAYKGLDVLAQAVELLAREGVAVELGVAGSGQITPQTRDLLDRLNANVENRWIGDHEISGILARYDAVACAHVEASQSGVAAAAFGHAMPVIAMPTGGIVEQVLDGRTGVLADGVSAEALAAAIRRLATTPGLYDTISRTLAQTSSQRSMAHFLKRVSDVALD